MSEILKFLLKVSLIYLMVEMALGSVLDPNQRPPTARGCITASSSGTVCPKSLVQLLFTNGDVLNVFFCIFSRIFAYFFFNNKDYF